MTSTAMWADYVLPAAAWYERTEHKWVTPLMPFIHGGEKVVSFAEAKSDWEIMSRLAQAVDAAAAARGIESFTDRNGRERSFAGLYDTFSSSGEFGHTDDDKVAGALVDISTNLEGVDWGELKKRGWARFTSVGNSVASIAIPRCRGACSSTWTRSSTSRWASSCRPTRTRRPRAARTR
jgi:anaerobic selenocysteine-containing dehydrogenase